MSEERKLILQMVADGKITAAEAELLMQAIDEGERTAKSTAAEGVRESGRSTGFLGELGSTIERAVNESLQHLDRELRHLEVHLDHKVRQHEHLRPKIEEKMRRVAERAAERAREAEERAARAAERAAERASRQAERLTERLDRVFGGGEPANRAKFFKTGISIDKETVEHAQTLTLPVEPADEFRLANRVGDIRVEFYEGTEAVVQVTKTVWGGDKADANARAEATQVSLERRGQTLEVEVVRPIINAVGIVEIKDTRIDYTVRLPQRTGLKLSTKVGDITVTGAQQVGQWDLETKVGDIDMQVGPDAGFRFDFGAELGEVVIRLGALQHSSHKERGTVGDGSGSIEALVKTGSVTIHSQREAT